MTFRPSARLEMAGEMGGGNGSQQIVPGFLQISLSGVQALESSQFMSCA